MKIVDLVWTVVALPNHRFMVWLAVQGRLLTPERKLRLHIPIEDSNVMSRLWRLQCIYLKNVFGQKVNAMGRYHIDK